jgi:glutathione S-transferase
MKLYYHPISTYSQKVVIAFAEKNVKFEPHVVDLMNPAAMQEYRSVNPQGKVPTMILDDGWKIPESSIIVEWLDTKHAGGTRLIPKDEDLARRTRFFDRLSDLYLNDPMQTILFDGMKPEADREPKRVAAAKKTLDIQLGMMDQGVGKTSPWILGEHFTMADCAAAPVLFYLRTVHPFTQHKNVEAYWNRVSERPSVKAAFEAAMPYLRQIGFAK